MKLSAETVLGIKRLCNSSLVNEDVFKKLLNDCSKAVVNYKTLPKKNTDDPKLDVIKAAYASLVILLTEAARHDIDTFMLKTILEGYNLNTDRIIFIVQTYEQRKCEVQRQLNTIGTNLPHIIDIHWRLDYTTKADYNSQLLLPYFHIEFVTLTSFNTKKIVRFVCSVENLQELVFLLKNAVRHLNKMINVLK